MDSGAIVIVGGGTTYFSNAWVAIRMTQAFGCRLPIELWVLPTEYDQRMERWLSKFNVEVRVAKEFTVSKSELYPGTRAEWALKVAAVLGCRTESVFFLDSDNVPVVDLGILFDTTQFSELGSVFWPDLRVMEPNRIIWDVMGVGYRAEPEFETGQMAIDKARCGEALEFALWMNRRADFFYQHIWGDKDTFRFAWRKYGLPFAMIPHPVQILEVPGGPPGVGVMCQHDFEGNRIFQHRNMAKWSLLGENPRIPGFLFEEECREFLSELRGLWNGRLNWTPPERNGHPEDAWRERARIARHLRAGTWLVEDRRRIPVCCRPAIEWSALRLPKPWLRSAPLAAEAGTKNERSEDARPVTFAVDSPPDAGLILPTSDGAFVEGRVEMDGTTVAVAPKSKESDPNAFAPQGLRCGELEFAGDSTFRTGTSDSMMWWDLVWRGGGWRLEFSSDKGSAALLRMNGKTEWEGRWRVGRDGRKLAAEFFAPESDGDRTDAKGMPVRHKGSPLIRLLRCEDVYPAVARRSMRSGAKRAVSETSGQRLRVANHAFGIGDAVTGLYACAGLADLGYKVTYHTRFPEWLERVEHPNVALTSDQPPPGTVDIDIDYAEQLRYATDKALWYGQFIAGKLARRLAAPPAPPSRPPMDRVIRVPRLDFSRYVILAPFAAWESRDWPQHHWRRLTWLLNQKGYEMVAIGTKKEAERLKETFDKSNAYWAVDHAPEWGQDAMLGADAVIGLDSGMMHVAGLLGVPAICIHSHLPPEFLFSCAPGVRSVTPKTDCVFCRWQGDRGFNEGCAKACSALATVGPEEVMASLTGMLEAGG